VKELFQEILFQQKIVYKIRRYGYISIGNEQFDLKYIIVQWFIWSMKNFQRSISLFWLIHWNARRYVIVIYVRTHTFINVLAKSHTNPSAVYFFASQFCTFYSNSLKLVVLKNTTQIKTTFTYRSVWRLTFKDPKAIFVAWTWAIITC